MKFSHVNGSGNKPVVQPDATDYYSIYPMASAFLLPMIIQLKALNNGIPDRVYLSLGVDSSYPTDEEQTLAIMLWDEILDKIIFALTICAKDDGLETNKDVADKVLEGTTLMGQYWLCLWD
jgi:hypothetical protein